MNTLSRVVGLDGMNRILMGSGPNGWRLGENVYEVPVERVGYGAYGVLSETDGTFALSALNEYRLDGIVISNDEPGAFTSSGSRDNAIFNIAIQGPTETNNGFLKYEDPTNATAKLYNPLTGVINCAHGGSARARLVRVGHAHREHAAAGARGLRLPERPRHASTLWPTFAARTRCTPRRCSTGASSR